MLQPKINVLDEILLTWEVHLWVISCQYDSFLNQSCTRLLVFLFIRSQVFLFTRSQVFLTLALVSVQFVATIIWCVLHHPGITWLLKCYIDYMFHYYYLPIIYHLHHPGKHGCWKLYWLYVIHYYYLPITFTIQVKKMVVEMVNTSR